MAQHKLTDGQRNEILNRWLNDGEAAKELAADYDVSIERIYQIVRASKLPMHQPHSGDFTNNGRKVTEVRTNVNVDLILHRIST